MNYLLPPKREVVIFHSLLQRFSTGGTRTTGGTPDVAKWYAKK